jgi:hypothetical protein
MTLAADYTPPERSSKRSVREGVVGTSSDAVVRILPCFYYWQAAHDCYFEGTQPLFGRVQPFVKPEVS